MKVSIEVCYASFFFNGMCFTMTKIENRELKQCHLSPNGHFSQPQVNSCTAKEVVWTILGTFISEIAQKEKNTERSVHMADRSLMFFVFLE